MPAGSARIRNRLSITALGLALGTATSVLAQVPERLTAPDTSWVARSALYEVFVRDFTAKGDLRGLTAGLDRIQAAGANTIWLMPIQPVGVVNRKGPLGSPYALKDYRAIDPAYGTPDDFKALVTAAHARGLKVILDFVPDHTSPDHPWVKDHPDFYFRDDQGAPSVPRDASGKLTDWTDVAQLDYGNPELRREMIAAMRFWLTEYDIDGFRFDVAGFIPYRFWSEAVPALRATLPRPIMILVEWGDLQMHRVGVDLTYAWDSYSRLKAVFRGGAASEFVDRELEDMQAMPPGGARMRFTTNHDETAWDNPPGAIFGGSAGARAAYIAMTLLPGRPLLYNGQEVESPQKLGLFVKDSVDWKQPKADEARSFYRKIIGLALGEPELLNGELRGAGTNAPNDAIAYRRGELLVLVNTRPRPVRVAVAGFNAHRAVDLLTKRIHAGRTVLLPAYGAVVLRRPGS
jgi:glycosidase